MRPARLSLLLCGCALACVASASGEVRWGGQQDVSVVPLNPGTRDPALGAAAVELVELSEVKDEVQAEAQATNQEAEASVQKAENAKFESNSPKPKAPKAANTDGDTPEVTASRAQAQTTAKSVLSLLTQQKRFISFKEQKRLSELREKAASRKAKAAMDEDVEKEADELNKGYSKNMEKGSMINVAPPNADEQAQLDRALQQTVENPQNQFEADPLVTGITKVVNEATAAAGGAKPVDDGTSGADSKEEAKIEATDAMSKKIESNAEKFAQRITKDAEGKAKEAVQEARKEKKQAAAVLATAQKKEEEAAKMKADASAENAKANKLGQQLEQRLKQQDEKAHVAAAEDAPEGTGQMEKEEALSKATLHLKSKLKLHTRVLGLYEKMKKLEGQVVRGQKLSAGEQARLDAMNADINKATDEMNSNEKAIKAEAKRKQDAAVAAAVQKQKAKDEAEKEQMQEEAQAKLNDEDAQVEKLEKEKADAEEADDEIKKAEEKDDEQAEGAKAKRLKSLMKKKKYHAALVSKFDDLKRGKKDVSAVDLPPAPGDEPPKADETPEEAADEAKKDVLQKEEANIEKEKEEVSEMPEGPEKEKKEAEVKAKEELVDAGKGDAEQSKDAESKDAESKDAESKDAESKDAEDAEKTEENADKAAEDQDVEKTADKNDEVKPLEDKDAEDAEKAVESKSPVPDEDAPVEERIAKVQKMNADEKQEHVKKLKARNEEHESLLKKFEDSEKQKKEKGSTPSPA